MGSQGLGARISSRCPAISQELSGKPSEVELKNPMEQKFDVEVEFGRPKDTCRTINNFNELNIFVQNRELLPHE